MVTVPAEVGGNHNSIPDTCSSQAVSQLVEQPMSHGLQRQNNEKCTHEDPIGWLERKQTDLGTAKKFFLYTVLMCFPHILSTISWNESYYM